MGAGIRGRRKRRAKGIQSKQKKKKQQQKNTNNKNHLGLDFPQKVLQDNKTVSIEYFVSQNIIPDMLSLYI